MRACVRARACARVRACVRVLCLCDGVGGLLLLWGVFCLLLLLKYYFISVVMSLCSMVLTLTAESPKPPRLQLTQSCSDLPSRNDCFGQMEPVLSSNGVIGTHRVLCTDH